MIFSLEGVLMSFVGIRIVVEIGDAISPVQLTSIVQDEQWVIVTCWKLGALEIISKIRNRFSSAVNRGQQDNDILLFFFFLLFFLSFFFSFSKAKRGMHTICYVTASQWHCNKIANSQFNVHLSIGRKCH